MHIRSTRGKGTTAVRARNWVRRILRVSILASGLPNVTAISWQSRNYSDKEKSRNLSETDVTKWKKTNSTEPISLSPFWHFQMWDLSLLKSHRTTVPPRIRTCSEHGNSFSCWFFARANDLTSAEDCTSKAVDGRLFRYSMTCVVEHDGVITLVRTSA